MAANVIHTSDDLLADLRAAAVAEGKSVDELAEQELRRRLAQRTLARMRREAEQDTQHMSDAEDVVDPAIRDSRDASQRP